MLPWSRPYNLNLKMLTISEASYPITFRSESARKLGDHLRHHHSVVLLGMKRVGISNFLRFFQHHPGIAETYIKNGPLLWVHVDLNNLVELSAQALWRVTLKRIVDSLETNQVDPALIKQAERLFAESIQLNDAFFTLDCVQKLLRLIAQAGYSTILVLMRFDRLRDNLTPELFANLQAVKDSGGTNMSYIFTSYRPLSELAPTVFTPTATAVFVRDMYVKPAHESDLYSMLKTFSDRYELHLPDWAQETVVELSGGHAQYLHLSLLKLKDAGQIFSSSTELKAMLENDDELRLASEEIISSLTVGERQALWQWTQGKKKLPLPEYLTETGIITAKAKFFSPLFEQVFESVQASFTQTTTARELTKKELALFELLQSRLGEVVERDVIIEVVWPDQVEMGVSDWALDRLVARLRSKLGTTHFPYQIVTVVSRGYKLVAA